MSTGTSVPSGPFELQVRRQLVSLEGLGVADDRLGLGHRGVVLRQRTGGFRLLGGLVPRNGSFAELLELAVHGVLGVLRFLDGAAGDLVLIDRTATFTPQ